MSKCCLVHSFRSASETTVSSIFAAVRICIWLTIVVQPITVQCQVFDVSTVAGSGAITVWTPGTGSGAGFGVINALACSSSNEVYIAGGNCVMRLSPPNVVSRFKCDASWLTLYGIAMGPSETYAIVADAGQHALFKVILSTTAVSTYAGIPGARGETTTNTNAALAYFNEPKHVAYDSGKTKLYVCDNGNYRIQLITVATNVVSPFVGTGAQAVNTYFDGPNADATIRNATGIAVHSNGDVYWLSACLWPSPSLWMSASL